MKKFWFLIGVAVGTVAGSGIGPEPYKKLRNAVQTLGSRPETQRVKDSLADAANEVTEATAQGITQVTEKVQSTVSSAVS